MINYDIFNELLNKIYPLYILITIGFILGKFVTIDRQTIARILFYVVVPIVFFDIAMNAELKPEYLLLPFIFFCISSILCLSFLKISSYIWKTGPRANVIGFSAGTGNTGYFGLPVAAALFDDEIVALYMLMNIGMSIYDYSVGAYVIARGKSTPKDAFIDIAKLPVIYAFMLGIILNSVFQIELSATLNDFAHNMRGCFVTLGMLIIGVGLAAAQTYKINIKFLSIMLGAKFIATPLTIMALIELDRYVLHLFNDDIYEAMLLISFAPPAVNTAIFATMHNSHPEEVATGVLIGTLLALLYIPMAVSLFIN